MACAHETQDEQRSDMQSAFGDLQPLEVRGRAFARAGAKAADGASRGGAGNAGGKNGGAAQGKVNVNSAAPSATPAFNSPSAPIRM